VSKPKPLPLGEVKLALFGTFGSNERAYLESLQISSATEASLRLSEFAEVTGKNHLNDKKQLRYKSELLL
jgi:hypothetical protein